MKSDKRKGFGIRKLFTKQFREVQRNRTYKSTQSLISFGDAKPLSRALLLVSKWTTFQGLHDCFTC